MLLIYPPDDQGIAKGLLHAHQQDDILEILLGSSTRKVSEKKWEIQTEDPAAFDGIIKTLKRMNMIYFLGGIQAREQVIDDLNNLTVNQERGVLSLFRLVKALSGYGFSDNSLGIKIVTNNVHRVMPNDVIMPFSASLHGFSKSLSKEFKRWEISTIDIRLKDAGMGAWADSNSYHANTKAPHHDQEFIIESILAESGNKNGDVVVIRSGQRYVRTVIPTQIPQINRIPFQEQGVYLILGGAGGIGLALCEYLTKSVQARVILIGRSVLDEARKEKIARMDSNGGKVLYIQADATDFESMKTAVDTAKSHFGKIIGVFHSAIVLRDKSIRNMDEETFCMALHPKVSGSVILHKVLSNEPLDFMMFFSSALSFTGNSGQSNYAAGCTFKDAFAACLNQCQSYPVCIVNWGYWGEVGVVSDDAYKSRLTAKGLLSITSEEGMDAVSRIAAYQIDQMLVIKIEEQVLENKGIDTAHQIEFFPLESPYMIKDMSPQILLDAEGFAHLLTLGHSKQVVMAESDGKRKIKRKTGGTSLTQPGQQTCRQADKQIETRPKTRKTSESHKRTTVPKRDTRNHIEALIIESLSNILNIENQEFDIDIPYTEFGVDSILAVEIADQINKKLSIQLRITDLFNYSTIRQLTDRVLDKYGHTFECETTKEESAMGDAQLMKKIAPASKTKKTSVPRIDKRTYIEETIIASLSDVLNIDDQAFDMDIPYTEFGVDSILAVEISDRINEQLSIQLRTTDLFNYATIRQLVDHILDEFGQVFEKINDSKQLEQFEDKRTDGLPIFEETVHHSAETFVPHLLGESEIRNYRTISSKQSMDDIAIIGISGRFPGAENIDEFWDNLAAGKDCIQSIPSDRWDFDEMLNPFVQSNKWGGFLSNPDQFDPQFFNISNREAELMDPQQRLFLQEAWHAFEDAGYTKNRLAEKKCAVFIGCSNGDYVRKVQSNLENIGAFAFTGNTASILPARISYFLNLKGPSVTVDTACSSSLVAIYLACESIWLGTSPIALAGGVMVMTTPEFYISAGSSHMLSPDGKCKTFDERADGFVPGEGVGVVVLKSYTAAVKDGDRIYGIIKGAGINQDGKTNGITAPGATSQTALECDVYERFQIHPESLSYIEAHGSGTKLGDPIEISALTDAFGKFTKKKQYCAIGSVKTNIGHSLTAAGIAGFIKVLLCLKYKKLVPSIHYHQKNRHIDFKESPFYVNTELTDWIPPANDVRRAAVSSFGFSGTNAHIIIEEYRKPQALNIGASKKEREGPHVIVLSARDEDRLKVYALEMKNYLEKRYRDAGRDFDLVDIAYTLQTGREPFNERLAVIVSSVAELCDRLTAYCDGRINIKNFYRGNARKDKLLSEQLNDEKSPDDWFRTVMDAKDIKKIARLWVTGVEMEWDCFYQNQTPSRISLPTYPFVRERYWIDGRNDESYDTQDHRIRMEKLHPMIEMNTSNLTEQKYTTHLSGDVFYVADHLVTGKKMLPGVAYLEMAYAAGHLAGADRIRKLRNVIWARPIVWEASALNSIASEDDFENFREIHIGLYPNSDILDYEIRTGTDAMVHSRGQIIRETSPQTPSIPPPINITSIQKRCAYVLKDEQIYDGFRDQGILYGPGFQVIKVLYGSETEALSRMELPFTLQGTFREYVLHPTILDGALQTVMGLKRDPELENGLEEGSLYLPFALGEVEIFNPLSASCYAYATLARASTSADNRLKNFDISILDETGQILVRLKNFATKAFDSRKDAYQESGLESLTKNLEESHGMLFFQEVWEDNGPLDDTPLMKWSDTGPVLLFGSATGHHGIDNNRQAVFVIPGACFKDRGNRMFEIHPNLPEDYSKLLDTLKNRGFTPKTILHMWSREPEEDISAQLDKGIHSLFHLSRALMKQKPQKNTIRMLYVHAAQKDQLPLYAGISGFIKTLSLEHPRLICKSVETDDLVAVPTLSESYLDLLISELHAKNIAVEVRFRDNRRFSKVFTEINTSVTEEMTGESIRLKTQGVYLITGGASGLGHLFARYLAKRVQARLILTGRSPVNPDITSKIGKLESLGSEVIYITSDVSDPEDVQKMITKAKDHFHGIDGLIHSAGVIRDGFIAKKNPEEMAAVLSSKVYGTVHLDEALKKEKLDFFVLFSSMAGISGNVGQADYAYANCFMNRFASKREILRKAGKCFGKTLSLNWPLWKEGGMHIDESAVARMKKSTGMYSLDTESGFRAFETALQWNIPIIIVAAGDKGKIRNTMSIFSCMKKITPETFSSVPSALETTTRDLPEPDNEKWIEETETYIKQILSEATKIPVHKMDSDQPLEEFGLDSIIITNLIRELEKNFGELDVTLFYEYHTIQELAGYFVKNHLSALISRTVVYRDPMPSKPVKSSELANKKTNEIIGEMVRKPSRRPRFLSVPKAEDMKEAIVRSEDIAIIGMGGRYPMADNLEAFWDNLKKGRNCITEIPESRWDYFQYYDPDKTTMGKACSKWGGFIADVDRFDPLFFHMSPKDAEMTDPLERLFLEIVWQTIEDSGYSKQTLIQKDTEKRQKTGVFVGCMNQHYPLLSNEKELTQILSNNSYWSIANRVSYFFNFHGPSLAVDTACSSSLTAICLAYGSIQRGECTMAIAGGINLNLHPSKYLVLDQNQILSSQDKSKSFGDSDGYIPGEGVGAVMLKSLSAAIEDKDNIYGLIKGTGMNHGGKTNGYRVPNPVAQADLIADVLKTSGIDPRQISYVESAANGSPLGDPIEVAGLKKAFGRMTDDKNYCVIGSVKSNIGHLEAASGISQLTKVLLQMKHRMIVPSIHIEKINPNLKIDNSPFYFQSELCEWLPETDEKGKPLYPRRAAISSLGAGGSNAHLIIEEYPHNLSERTLEPEAELSAHLLIFSAKTLERLHVLLKRMRKYVAGMPDISMRNMAYTLQVAREPMEVKIAMIVKDTNEFIDTCDHYLNTKDQSAIETIFENRGTDNQGLNVLLKGKTGLDIVESAIKDRDLSKLALLWTNGVSIDWQKLYTEDYEPLKIKLPGYPFERKRCWIYNNDKIAEPVGALATSISAPADSWEKAQEEHLLYFMKEIISNLTGIQEENLQLTRPFTEFGFDSIKASQLKYEMEKKFAIQIPIAVLGESRTIEELIHRFVAEFKLPDTAKLKSPDVPCKKKHESVTLDRFLEGQLEINELSEVQLFDLFNDLERQKAMLLRNKSSQKNEFRRETGPGYPDEKE